MPESREYVVTQVREVRVTANSAPDAVRIAAAAFEHGQNIDNGVALNKAPAGVWGNTRSRIREVEIHARDARP